MILYHGSSTLFAFPDYAEMSEKTFPLGLWVSPTIEDARTFGRYVYELQVDCIPVLLSGDTLLNKPRHIHVRDGRDMMITQDRRSIVIINFDVITSFRYIEDQAHQVIAFDSLRGR
jgi:hypothetical protein